MNLFRTCAAVLTLSCTFVASTVQAQQSAQNVSGDPTYTLEAPDGYAVVGDLLIARPLLIGATLIGAAAFVVSLPFTAMGGGIGATGRALVVEPGKAAFVRCLGCTGDGYNKRQ
jgi:hypothetical protein